MYKCPHCGATGESRTVDEGPDEYDSKYPVWTKCAACDVNLFGEAKDYIIDGDDD